MQKSNFEKIPLGRLFHQILDDYFSKCEETLKKQYKKVTGDYLGPMNLLFCYDEILELYIMVSKFSFQVFRDLVRNL